MIKNNSLKNPVLSYFLITVIIFLVFLGFIGALMALDADVRITNALQIVASWSSTFAFVILFKRLYPDQKLKTFIKNLFKEKLNPYVMFAIISVQAIIFMVSLYLLSTFAFANYGGVLSLGIVAFIILILNHLARGPLGEELGWRGFLQNELEKKHSTLKSSLIVGLLWGIWHTPLWMVSGYQGIELLMYSTAFLVGVISLSVIMGFFYKLNKNLFIPIMIHFFFNFLVALIIADLLAILICVCGCYLIAAIILVIINPRKVLRAIPA